MYFFSNCKVLREKEGRKLVEMLDFIGIKTTTWGGYERGDSLPKLEDFIRICKKFDISETDILHTDLSKEAPKHLPKVGIWVDYEVKYYELLHENGKLKDKIIELQEFQNKTIKKQQLIK